MNRDKIKKHRLREVNTEKNKNDKCRTTCRLEVASSSGNKLAKVDVSSLIKRAGLVPCQKPVHRNIGRVKSRIVTQYTYVKCSFFLQ